MELFVVEWEVHLGDENNQIFVECTYYYENTYVLNLWVLSIDEIGECSCQSFLMHLKLNVVIYG